MSRALPIWFAALLYLFTTPRADAEAFYYVMMTASPTYADSPGTGVIAFDTPAVLTAIGQEPWQKVTYGVPVPFDSQLFAEDFPLDGSQDVFTASPWSLTIHLFERGGAVEPTFTGVIDGALSKDDLSLRSTLTSPAVHLGTVNNRLYTVRFDSITFLDAPTNVGRRTPAYQVGTATGTITVVAALPEPSALVLAAFSPLAIVVWRGRRRR